MSKINTTFKVYSNRSNARRAAASAKLAEGTFELKTLEGGKCELIEVKAAPAPAAKPAKAGATQANRKAREKAAAQVQAPAEAPAAAVATEQAKPERKLAKTVKFHEALLAGGCPECGDVHNGCTPDSSDPNYDGEWLFCHMCGTSFSSKDGRHRPSRKAPANVKPRGPQPKGYKIEKTREERNGIKRYSEGTLGAKVWAICDAEAAKLPGGIKDLTAALAKAACEKQDINATQAGIEFYCWRRFNGVRGRIILKKAMDKPVKTKKGE